MQQLAKTLGAGSCALSGLLGLAVITIALAVFMTPMDVGEVIDWAERIFGILFILFFAALVYTALLSIVQVKTIPSGAPGHRTWYTGFKRISYAGANLYAARNKSWYR